MSIISAVICVYSLRANNEHMVKLRDAVYAADKDNGDVSGALKALQAYVTTHMNTSLAGPDNVYPPIQLKYTYDRLVQAQSQQTQEANTQIYSDAQNYCQALIPNGFSGRYRVPCIEQYVQTHSPASTPAIPDALYKFDFASPNWSPDRAGWSMVVAGLSAILFVVTLIANRIARRKLA